MTTPLTPPNRQAAENYYRALSDAAQTPLLRQQLAESRDELRQVRAAQDKLRSDMDRLMALCERQHQEIIDLKRLVNTLRSRVDHAELAQV